jgi:hypothetical protein
MGLVAWLNGKGRRGTRYWLTPEGAKVAELLAKGFQVGKATLTALATDRLRRKMAHQNGTPTENNTMLPYGSYNECSLTAVVPSKPVRKPLSPLAERLCRDYGIRWWVAEDLVARYSPLEIKAAIALLERRNGAIYNPAGFIVYLLREGYARRLAEAWLRDPQCARPPRKPPDEPDWDAIVAALRDTLAPYGIRVDDEGSADFPNGRVKLPPDPDEALDLLRRHGLLRDGNGQDADQDPADAPDQAPTDADALTDDAPTVADATEALRAADDATTGGDDGDDDDDGEPLPPPSCDLCGRKEGEPHPALASWQRNDFLCLSELSDDFKQRFGLPEAGLLCRGCYVTLCRTLCPADQDQNTEATETDQAPKDNDDAIADAKPDSHQPDRSDGQNDPSDDSENCPNPLVKVFLLPDSAAEAFQPVVRDLMTAFKTKGVTEIVKDGITYRLKGFCPLEGGLAFALIEVDATTLPPETQALIDELCRLYKRDGTVAIERGCLRVEIAEVIRLAEGKALYRFSVTKLDKGRKQR